MWDLAKWSYGISGIHLIQDPTGWQNDVEQSIDTFNYIKQNPHVVLAEMAKDIFAWDSFSKGHYSEAIGELIFNFGSALVGVGEIKVATSSLKVGNKLSNARIKRLQKDLGKDTTTQLINDLGQDSVVKLMAHLSPAEIANFNTKLGPTKTNELLNKYNSNAMAHYGPDFFAEYKGITEQTMNHVLKFEGIKDRAILGAHDKDEFLKTLQGRGQVLSEYIDPANSSVTHIEYKLYVKDKAGNIGDPPVLSTGKIKNKTVIEDFELNQDAWIIPLEQEVDNLIKQKNLGLDDKVYVNVNGVKVLVQYRHPSVTTFYPEA